MTAPRPIPDALLERYLADDLPPALKRTIEHALETSAALRARLEALRADNQAFFVTHPVGPLAARLETPRRSWLAAWAPAFAATAAVVVAAIVYVRRESEGDYSAKGNLALTVHRRTAAGSEVLAPGAAVHAGDTVRFELRAPAAGFVAVLSADAAGKVSVYHPTGGTSAAPYRPQEPLLPTAIALDATLGPETVYAVYANQPFELRPLINQLEAGAPLRSGGGLEVETVTWVK
jgi:hypothetical protein